MRRVRLDVGAAGHTVEDIISGEVDEPGVGLAAGTGKVGDSERVGLEGFEGLTFREIDLVVRGGIDDQRRVDAGEAGLDSSGVGDVQLRADEGDHLIAASRENTLQIGAQLAASAKENHFTRTHSFELPRISKKL